VTREEQLEWEARWAIPVAASSVIAGLLTIIGVTTFLPKDREGIETTPDLLLSIDEHSGGYMTSAIVTAVGVLFLIPVFLYLFRAILARGGAVPRWFVYMVVGAPVLYAISRVAYAVEAIDIADEFAAGTPIRGEAGSDRAEDLSDVSALVIGLQTAGTVGVAFLFVMLPLRARRVGLMSPFMAVLGAICGALVVFPLAGISSVIQTFWLIALGALFLGRWPGGRGPAWETGEAEHWPSAAERRGLTQPAPPEPDPSAPPPEAEPVPERPASRKRRKKRGR
jgi:hypothetical protein